MAEQNWDVLEQSARSLRYDMPAAGVASRIADTPRQPWRLRRFDQGDRHATWLELFFDLVFVVAIAELAGVLHEDVSALGWVHFIALFVPVWWVWMGFTFYADQFDNDDVPFRLIMLIAMLATAALAVNIPSVSHGDVGNFVIAYVVLHILLIGLYLRSARDPLVRPLCVRFLAGYAASAILWAASLLLPGTARYALWMLGLLIEMAAPILAWRALPGAIVADAAHTAERFGLFTIIVLGESVVVVVSATAAYDWQLRSALVAAGGFVIVACFWWLYFGAAHTAALRQVLHRGMLPGFIYGYSHLLVFVSLTAVSVGVQSAIDSAAHNALLEGTRTALSGGIGGYLIGMSIICLVTDRSIRRRTLLARFGMVAFVVLVALLGGQLGLLAFVGTLVVALVLLLIFEAAFADR